jgi:PTH1 family peptidyl-tRNA hydrolase
MSDKTPIAMVVGLGNPGPEYERTRHNAGFWFLDRLAQGGGVAMRNEAKFCGRVGKLGRDIWLLQPQTYMNGSGQAVAALARFHKIAPQQILVVHDELDLKPGEVKLKLGGGSAGHNGLRDITAQLGTPEFWRLRLGIGHPRDLAASQQEVVDYVLHAPRAEELAAIREAITYAIDAWAPMRDGDMERAMHQLHTKRKA